MTQLIPQLDLTRTEIPQYSHQDVCEILGLSSNVLQLLNKRGFARPVSVSGAQPSVTREAPSRSGKRGKGRRYSISDLTYLGLFQIMSRYVDHKDAAETARISVPDVLQTWFTSGRKDDSYLVFSEIGGLYAISFCPHANLAEQLNATDLVIVSLGQLAARLFAGMSRVAYRRK